MAMPGGCQFVGPMHSAKMVAEHQFAPATKFQSFDLERRALLAALNPD